MRDTLFLRNGTRVGAATSRWFVLDMNERQAVRPHSLFPAHLQPQTEHLLALSRAIAPMPEPATLGVGFDVRQSDIDLNRHVTAATYVGWALEAVPERFGQSHWLTMLDVMFLEECHLGDQIQSESHQANDNVLCHRITRKTDARELARLTTAWKAR
jgi:medium-chain acyl-[acyl-carrier-protein] hydrolase